MLALVATACSAGDDSTPAVGLIDAESVIAEGALLYAGYCASCHGADLEGAPNWMTPNSDGSYNPPPQNVSGHTWHHGDLSLVQLISQGSSFPQSRMPAFGDALTDDQIKAILEFLKANWGERERAFQAETTQREISASS